EIGTDERAPDGEVVGVELDVALNFVGGVGDGHRQLDIGTRMFAKVASALRRRHGWTWSGATSRKATLSSPWPTPGASIGPRETRVAETVAAAPGGSDSKALAGTANSPSSRTRQRTAREPAREVHFTSRSSGSVEESDPPAQRTYSSCAWRSGSSDSDGNACGAAACARNGPTSSPPSPATWYGWPSASATGCVSSPPYTTPETNGTSSG